jgi:HEAT repeat protein
MSPESIDLMAALMEKGPDQDKMRAAMALASARVATPEIVALLLKHAASKSREVRAATLHALARGRSPQGAAAIRTGTTDKEWQVQMYALLGLQEFPPSAENTQAALTALNAEDTSARLSALQSLRKVAFPSAESRTLLLKYLRKEASPRLQATALQALADRFPGTTVAEITRFFNAKDPQVRAAALRVAQTCRLQKAGSNAMADLKHPHPIVRRQAILTLAACAPESALPALLPLSKDGDVTVRQALTQALTALAKPESFEALQPLQEDPFRHIRRGATTALLAVAKANTEARLKIQTDAVTGAGSPTPERRVESLYTLGKLRNPQVLPAILKTVDALGEEALPERRLAIWAIGQCGKSRFDKRVLKAALHTDGPLRLHGAMAIGLLKYERAIPTIGQTLGKVKAMEGVWFYVYGGLPRLELLRSLKAIGGPKAIKVALERIGATRVLEPLDCYRVATDILLENRVLSAETPLRMTYRHKEASLQLKKHIVLSLRKLLGREDVELEMPEIPPAYDHFFMNAR